VKYISGMSHRFTESKQAFIEAECFLIAYNYIIQQDNESGYGDIWQFVGVGTAAQVNHAFATEMYLKCLLILTNTYDKKKQHHLGLLFDKLPPPVRQKLNYRYKKYYQKEDIDVFDATKYSLRDLLHKTGDYFKHARYSFEKKRGGKHARYHMTIGINAIRDIILELSPDLKQVSYAK